MDERSSRSASVDARGEFPFAPQDYVFILITTIVRHRDARFERLLRPLGLNVARHRALLVVERFEPCTMTELADFSAVERTTMTRTVDQLVASRLIERTKPTEDRRQVVLTLTPEGRTKIVAAMQIVRQQNREDLDGIPEETQRDLIRLSQGLAANMAPDAATRERVLTFRRPAR